MKNFLTKAMVVSATFLGITAITTGQMLSVQWARQISGTSVDHSRYIAVDDTGNVYSVGNFEATADFDPGPGVFNLSTIGSSLSDAFITKLDGNGNLVWAKQIGGSGIDEAVSVVMDVSGNIYTIGTFNGTVDFDPGAGTYSLSSFGGADIYVSKLDNGGNFVWAKQMGGSDVDAVYSIVLDDSANVYTVGAFNGTSDFDPGVGTANLSSLGGASFTDGYISKLDVNGNFVWVKQIEGDADDNVNAITLDGTGNICIAGQFGGTTDFDPGAGNFNMTATAGGNPDIFVSKLDLNGVFVWAQQMGGTETELINSMAIDASGGIYTTGSFRGTADFDPGAGNADLVCIGGSDIFISKLDVTGSYVWVKQLAGSGSEVANSIAISGSGNIYTTGFFQGTVDFDPGAGTYDQTAIAGNDIFLSKISPAGNFMTVNQFGGYSGEVGSTVVADDFGNIYMTGYFQDTVDFAPGLAVLDLNTPGFNNKDAYILKLSGCVPPSMPSPISGPDTICMNAVVTYSVANDPMAVSYSWYLPADWTGSSTTNSINVTVGSTSGMVVVTANTCISSIPRNRHVEVIPAGHIIANAAPSNNICDGQNVTLSGSNGISYTWTGGVTDGVAFIPTGTDTYTVTGTDVNGCTNTDAITVTVNHLPTVTLNYSGDDTLCTTDGLQALNGGSPVGGIYSGNGVSGSNFDPATAGIGIHTVTYTYTDANGCTNFQEIELVVETCSSGIDNENNSSISVYPNPFMNAITIEGIEANTKLNLYNVLGEAIHSWYTTGSTLTVIVDDLEEGVYFLHIEQNDNILIQKMIKN